MKIYLHEIRDVETRFDFDGEETWVHDTVAAVDETGLPAPKNRESRFHVALRRVDGVVVVKGQVGSEVHLSCSRCAIPFPYGVERDFTVLYSKDPVLAGAAYRVEGESRVEGRVRGLAKSAHQFEADDADLDITYLTENFIRLDQVLAEQLQIQIPFQPLCKPECKGLCPRCGADFNQGRCACAATKEREPLRRNHGGP